MKKILWKSIKWQVSKWGMCFSRRTDGISFSVNEGGAANMAVMLGWPRRQFWGLFYLFVWPHRLVFSKKRQEARWRLEYSRGSLY